MCPSDQPEAQYRQSPESGTNKPAAIVINVYVL